MNKTRIEWCDMTWNPVTGCTHVSEGCRNCYAERQAKRFGTFDVTLHPDRLHEPLRRKKPTTIFVCSMGDLFHKDVPVHVVARVWQVMRGCEWHKFMILTKRPERMAKLLNSSEFWSWLGCNGGASLPGVWLGVSIEDQATADERIPWLLRTPAAHRFVSYEPALGPARLFDGGCPHPIQTPYGEILGPGAIDLVIAGGETGPHARPAHPDWFRSVRDQCAAAGVPFLFKQWGEFASAEEISLFPGATITSQLAGHGGSREVGQWYRVGRARAGRLLDGVEHNAGPREGK